MAIKIYENDDIYVRPFVESDITERYLEWYHDQEVCKYNSHGKLSHGIDYSEYYIPDNAIAWAVISKFTKYGSTTLCNDTLIGKVVLEINWINRNAEFTCIFGEKEYWGKGHCTQVLKWMIDHGFNKLNLHKIWLGTAQNNTGMIKAAEKNRMSCEANLEDDVFLNGIFLDIKRMSIFND